jgi:hypothetical protein
MSWYVLRRLELRESHTRLKNTNFEIRFLIS